jgi:hypothetical protein
MACNHNTLNCGCKDTYLTTPPPCPTPADCPDPQPCSEVFDAQCITYTGTDILCDQDVIVAQNDSVATALDSIVQYFCTAGANLFLENPLQCTGDPVGTIAAAGTSVNQAIEDVVDYFCGEVAALTPAYKIYRANLTQTLATAPTANVLENTLSGTPTFAYVNVGRYTMTLTGEFILDTHIIANNFVKEGLFKTYRQDNDTIVLITTDTAFAFADQILDNTSIEIKVYL